MLAGELHRTWTSDRCRGSRGGSRQPPSAYLLTDISDPAWYWYWADCCCCLAALLFFCRKQVHSSLNQLLRSRQAQASFIHDAVRVLCVLARQSFYRHRRFGSGLCLLPRRCNCCAMQAPLYFNHFIFFCQPASQLASYPASQPACGDFRVVWPLCVSILALVIPLQQNNFGALCVRPNLWVGPKFGNFGCHIQGKDMHKYLNAHCEKI